MNVYVRRNISSLYSGLSGDLSKALRACRLRKMRERSAVYEGKNIYVCASSFEEFLYRFWMENILWYKLVWYKGRKPLTEEEKSYLSYYLP